MPNSREENFGESFSPELDEHGRYPAKKSKKRTGPSDHSTKTAKPVSKKASERVDKSVQKAGENAAEIAKTASVEKLKDLIAGAIESGQIRVRLRQINGGKKEKFLEPVDSDGEKLLVSVENRQGGHRMLVELNEYFRSKSVTPEKRTEGKAVEALNQKNFEEKYLEPLRDSDLTAGYEKRIRSLVNDLVKREILSFDENGMIIPGKKNHPLAERFISEFMKMTDSLEVARNDKSKYTESKNESGRYTEVKAEAVEEKKTEEEVKAEALFEAEAKRAKIKERFETRRQEIKKEIKALSDKLYGISGQVDNEITQEEAKEIAHEIAELYTEETQIKFKEGIYSETEEQAEKDVRYAGINLQLHQYLDSIQPENASEISVSEIANRMTGADSTLGEILSYGGKYLTPEMVARLNALILPDKEGNRDIELTTENQLIAKTDKGSREIMHLKQQLELEIMRQLIAEGGEKDQDKSTEEKYKVVLAKGQFRELLRLAGDETLIRGLTAEVVEFNIEITPSGEIKPLNDLGAEYLQNITEAVRARFKEELVSEMSAAALAEFKENDPLYLESKKQEENDRGVAESVRRKLLIHSKGRFFDAVQETTLKYSEEERALRETKLANKAYVEKVAKYLRSEAELRADVIGALAKSEQPDIKALTGVMEKSKEVIYGKSLPMKEASRLLKQLGKEAKDFEVEEKHLPTTVELQESLGREARKEILSRANDEAIGAIEKLLGLNLSEEDLYELAADEEYSEYLQTFITKAAAIKRVKELVSAENKKMDFSEVRNISVLDVIQTEREAKEMFGKVARRVARSKSRKLGRLEIDKIFEGISVGLTQEELDERKQEAINQLEAEVDAAFTEPVVEKSVQRTSPVVEKSVQHVEHTDLDLDDEIAQTTGSEISSWNSLRTTGGEISKVRSKKRNTESILSILFPMIFGGNG